MNTTPRLDHLDLSAALVIILFSFVSLAVAVMVLHAGLQSENRTGKDAAVFRSLGMSTPALFPSGRPERAPELIDPRIDLRHTPYLSIPDPDPAKMVLTPL